MTAELLTRLQWINNRLLEIEKHIFVKLVQRNEDNFQANYELKTKLECINHKVTLKFYDDKWNRYPFVAYTENIEGYAGQYGNIYTKFNACKNFNKFLIDNEHPMYDDFHCWTFFSLYAIQKLNWRQISSLKYLKWEMYGGVEGKCFGPYGEIL